MATVDSQPATDGVTCRLHQTGRKIKISPGILDESQQRRSPTALWSLCGHNEPKKPSKNECFKLKFIEKLKFQNFRILFFWFFKKEENKTSFNKNDADQARPKLNETEVRRSIDRYEGDVQRPHLPHHHHWLHHHHNHLHLWRRPPEIRQHHHHQEHHGRFTTIMTILLIKTSDGQPRQVRYLGDVRDHSPLAPGSNTILRVGRWG